ncbi:MAG: helix-turn-helix domain-containing protein [Eubacteriales bacterium]|nr:helix-turn-helix domain-containing protein [Eubacteriales bacterium]
MFIQERISQMQAQQKHPKEIIYAATSGIQNIFSEELYISTRNQLTEAKTPYEINTLLDAYFSSQPPEQTGSQYSRLIQSAIQYIQQHYQEQISLTTAAESLSITSQYLSKLFMQETSRTFIDYLTNVRIDKAKVYLTETNLQINVIGARTGYTDPKYFCTVFKKIVGLTPNQYRKANNNK